MHGCGKSDRTIVPEKSANNDTDNKVSAEWMEGRGLAKGNTREQNRLRTQRRDRLQSELGRIRQIAATNKEVKFTALWHHVYNIDRLRECYYGLKRDSAKGVDGETWEHYGENLETNLQGLSDRLKRGAYHAKPVRRVYIPKPDGRKRPIGIPALEDKIVQGATSEVLSAIYEADFREFSYGFRPGRSQHNALDALYVGLMGNVDLVLDIDLRSFFDTIDHGWMMKFIEHRISDKRVLRHIKKWLNAGVLEDGKVRRAEYGTPQGGSISPLLANIYLHYALDNWVELWRNRKAYGNVVAVRYADDAVFGFQYRRDAERFLMELKERLSRFHLELNTEKTRLIEFGRFAAENRKMRGECKPETFDFLGFTHICDRTHTGRFIVLRKSQSKKVRAKLNALRYELERRMHSPIPEVGKWLASVLRGHYRYYGVPRNIRSMVAFRFRVAWLWHHTLNRRSQRGRVNWTRMRELAKHYLPYPTITQPYPEQRLRVFT